MSKYRIRITNDKYLEQYKVVLLKQRSFRFLWWAFSHWEQIYCARGSVLLISSLVRQWFIKYELCEADMEDVSV